MKRLNPGNPMGRALAANLIFEAIVFLLAIAGMIQVENLAVGVAVGVGGGAALLALLASARPNTTWGWSLGWLTQVVAIGMGLATSWMYGIGAVFAGLHVLMYVLGRRLDARGIPSA